NGVSPGYFATMGMPLLHGREFSDADVAGAPNVAVVNETMARYFFGKTDVLGRRFTTDDSSSVFDVEIVGVVRDAKYTNLRETTPRHFYTPLWQATRLFGLTLHARGDAPVLERSLRELLRRIDPAVPLASVTTLQAQ